MSAVKAVLDTSVLVSAFIKPRSLPGAVVRAGIAGRYDLCVFVGILALVRIGSTALDEVLNLLPFLLLNFRHA
jgi:predicted nucleic acid-binding protein